MQHPAVSSGALTPAPERPLLPRRRALRWLGWSGAVALVPAAAWAQQPASGAPIVIGQTIATAGPMAAVTAGVVAGARLALEEANARGGINGRPVMIKILDDGFDPKRALENTQTLVEKEGAIALFGSSGTAHTAAMLAYLTPKKIPLIASYTGTTTLRGPEHPYYFTTQASYADELGQITHHALALQRTRVAMLYQNDSFGKALLTIAEKAAADNKVTVVLSQPVQPDASDVSAAVQALTKIKIDAVVMIVTANPVVPTVRALRTQLGSLPIYTFSLSMSAAVIKTLGEDVRGLTVVRSTPYPWNTISPLARQFAKVAKQANEPVTYDLFLGYINGLVLLEGLRRANGNFTPEGVVEGMHKIGKWNMGGHSMDFGPQRNHGSDFTEITTFGAGGRIVR